MLNDKLDREYKSNWEFIVRATDEGGLGLTGYADIEVVVGDINDNSPYFPNLEYKGSVPENSRGGEYIILYLCGSSRRVHASCISRSVVSSNWLRSRRDLHLTADILC